MSVLIVGGGPAGLTASILLSRLGVDTLLVERRAVPSPLPRARGVHARAMEILRVAAVEEDLRRHALPIQRGAEWRAVLAGPVQHEVSTGGPTVSEVSPCEGLALSQDVLETVLTEHARSYSSASLWMGSRLESFSATDEGLSATVVSSLDPELRHTVDARYLIAADGVHSQVRNALGIGLAGDPDLGGQLNLSFRADLTRWTSVRPRGIYFLTDLSAALFWTHDDHRWVLGIPYRRGVDKSAGAPGAAGGVPGDAAAVAMIHQALGDESCEVNLLSQRAWTAVAQSADRYGSAPVFLVGDAAHQVPPAGATGVSSAIHDVHNLTWKLAAVLRGEAGAGLLDSYQQERGPVGSNTTREMAEAWSGFWTPGYIPFQRTTLQQIDFGYQYTSSAVVSDGTPVAPETGDYVPRAAPGCRAPHIWLDDTRRRSTLDLFDRGYTLVTPASDRSWSAAVAATPSLESRVRVETVDVPSFSTAYGIGPTGAVLVRPDGHVAWRRPSWEDAAGSDRGQELQSVLGQLVGTRVA